jgi:hypothetical protein
MKVERRFTKAGKPIFEAMPEKDPAMKVTRGFPVIEELPHDPTPPSNRRERRKTAAILRNQKAAPVQTQESPSKSAPPVRSQAPSVD